MKIVYVLGGLPFGGIRNLLFDFTQELSNRGDVAYIFNLSGTGIKYNETTYPMLNIINVSSSLKAIKTYRIDTVLRLRKLIKKYNPDIVHTMEFSGDYFGRLALMGLKIPIITHIHNIKKEKKIHRSIANKILSYKTDLFLSVSTAVRNHVDSVHNIAKRKNIVLYNAIDEKRFNGIKHEKKGVLTRIVGIGRLVKQKNFDLLIKAFKKVKEEFPAISLSIIGEGRERENLEKLINELNLTKDVSLPGYSDNIPAILACSDLFVMPSESEGFGNAYLEAMCMAIPGIISEFVPLKEIASECSLVCKTDTDNIADKMKKLLTDNKLYEQFSIKAKEIAADHTIGKYADDLVKIYNSLIARDLDR